MQQNNARRERAFTLIELLIVVAIIAILAAIAVPNFLEAQARAKVSRAKADIRSLATGMEAYYVDNNEYCPDSEGVLDKGQGTQIPYEQYAKGQIFLTTPIAYLTSVVQDPFDSVANSVGTTTVKASIRIGSGTWAYHTGLSPKDLQDSTNTMATRGKVATYALLSVGPDGLRCRNSYKSFPWKPLTDTDQKPITAKNYQPNYWIDYDPTNGTVSDGDIYRFGGDYLRGDWDRNEPNAGPRGPAAN